MKKLFFLLFALVPLVVHAQETDYSIVIGRTDGTVLSYTLLEKPVITFTASALKVTTPTASVEIPKSELQGWTFEDDGETNISLLPVSAELRWIDAYTLVVSGLQKQDYVSVYTAQGADVTTNVVTRLGDEIMVSVANMPQGVYLMNMNQYHITKLIRK